MTEAFFFNAQNRMKFRGRNKQDSCQNLSAKGPEDAGCAIIAKWYLTSQVVLCVKCF